MSEAKVSRCGTAPVNYLSGYPASLVAQVQALIDQDKLAAALLAKYPEAHVIRSDSALFGYVQALKERYLRTAGPLSKVRFDNTLHVVRNALGTHTRISRVQGGKLKAKREVRIASVFKAMPEDFLRMIVVHELAHIKEPQHDKAFYQLCTHMAPDYHQLEFDVRTYLMHLEATQRPLWA